jgi:hypothetical protein
MNNREGRGRGSGCHTRQGQVAVHGRDSLYLAFKKKLPIRRDTREARSLSRIVCQPHLVMIAHGLNLRCAVRGRTINLGMERCLAVEMIDFYFSTPPKRGTR